MKFVQLLKSLQEGPRPVYLLEGEEAYFRDRGVEQIRAAADIAEPALNDLKYEGETLKGKFSAFVPELFTLPFFGARRLVRIYEFYPSEREGEVLSRYAKSPCATTVLLIVNAKKSGLAKAAGVTFVDCAKESEETLGRWLYGAAKKAGVSIDGDAATLMVRYCNRDAARMKLEIEKLALLLGKDGRIGRAEVEEYVAKDVEYKIYELTQAATRSRAEFTEILHDLLDKGFDESGALAALTSYFRTLSEVASAKGSDAAAGEALGLKPYAVKKNRETVARLGRERVLSLYLDLYGLGAGMRSGMYTKSGALSAAICKIFFG